MRPEKQPCRSCIFCETNHTLVFLLTIASVFMTAAAEPTISSSSYLKIPALGRTSQLGFLYDERTDAFWDVSIFSKAISTDFIVTTQNTDVSTEARLTNTYADKIELLGISLNAAVNILAGNTKARGTAGILKESNANSLRDLWQQGTLLRTHYTVVDSLQVFYSGLQTSLNTPLLQRTEATHVVTGISWGSRLAVTLQTTVNPDTAAQGQGLSNAFSQEFQKIQGHLENSAENGGSFNLTVDNVKSDIPLSGSGHCPTTTKDVAALLNKIPDLIKGTSGGKGVPLEFTLTPLLELRSHLNVQQTNANANANANNSVQQIPESTLRSLTRIFDDLLNSEQRINALYEKTFFQLNCLPSESREDIIDLRTFFLDYKKQFADNLKTALVHVRSGSKPTSALTDIAQEYRQSNSSFQNTRNKIREYDQVVEKVSFCQMIQSSYSGIEYFGGSSTSTSLQNLIPRISENSDKQIYILFTKTEFKDNEPAQYTENLNTFLKTLYGVPSNKLLIVDCDYNAHAFCTKLTNQTEIHEYKNGKLTSTDFNRRCSAMEESTLEKRINDLESKILSLQNLTDVTLRWMAHCGNTLCAGAEGSFDDLHVSKRALTKIPCENGAGGCVELKEAEKVTCASSSSDLCLNGGTCRMNESNSYSCVCAVGFAGSSCEHVNHCAYPGACHSLDINNATCHTCRDGYVKDPLDGARCITSVGGNNASLIISSSEGITEISLNEPNANNTRILQTEDSVRGLDYNSRTSTIFWFSNDAETVYTAPFKSGGRDKTVVAVLQAPPSYIRGLAVDWIYNHIYWADTDRKTISVSNLNGTLKRVLITSGLQWPSSIVVNPLNGWMHWADQRKSRIERAALDGSRREVIVNTSTKQPRGLALDLLGSRLYWTDAKHPSSISSSNFDGSDRQLTFKADSQPIFSGSPSSYFDSITIFQNDLYWIDYNSKIIYKANKCNGEEFGVVYKSKESILFDIKVIDAANQPDGENHCEKRVLMGQCSHFCFPVPKILADVKGGNGSVPVSTSCACPDGLTLSSNKQNCY